VEVIAKKRGSITSTSTWTRTLDVMVWYSFNNGLMTHIARTNTIDHNFGSKMEYSEMRVGTTNLLAIVRKKYHW